MEKKGWDDIGYHFVIAKTGVIERGRSIDKIGAHAAPRNFDSIGICLTGNLTFDPIQFDSLDTLLLLLKNDSNIRGAQIVPHSIINRDKTCPNFDLARHKNLWNAV